MTDTTIGVQLCLDRLRRGDLSARDEIIAIACNRLTILARKMLNDYGRLRKYEQTDDISQNAMIRLHKALQDVQPETAVEFFGLAAHKMRQVLHDEVRFFFGRKRDQDDGAPRMPDNSPAHAISGQHAEDSTDGGRFENADQTHDPAALAQWTEFHSAVESLPPKERQIVDLLFYHGLSQIEAATMLQIDPSTAKRRWRSARLKLYDLLKDTLPDF